MKKVFSVLTIAMVLSLSAFAQKKTETFAVSGNCGMCKNKIETAAKDAGATKATWDDEKKQITVEFKAKKTSLDAIQKKIAEVGYDNAKYKAEASVYDKLHGCCKYERSM